MRFREDGTFKIMQITDMQEIPAISKDTIALMERAVLEEQPDLVVYTGDQIKGYGVTYKGKGEELEREVAQTIGKLLEPVTKRGIPFAVTFGNHDCQVGISNQDQFYHIYKRLPNCIGEQAEGIDGGGTCAIPIEASDGSGRDVFELYLFDSGTDAREGGYEAFDPKIIAWYRKQREDLREKNGMYVPSIVFQHIPMREVGEVARIISRRYGDQSFKSGEENSDLSDELCDVFWVLLCLANQTGVDLTSAFEKNMEKKTNRDKTRHINNPKLTKNG